jgi:DNA-binding HxlR family transcriptional regulator
MTLTQNVLVDGSDKLFFSQRILIMKMLLKGEVDFSTFKRELKIADGSLFSHLRALEQEKFIIYRKEFHGRRPATIYTITEKGRTGFNDFKEYMIDVLS